MAQKIQAMTNASAQMAMQMPIHVAQPTKECEVMWIEWMPLRHGRSLSDSCELLG